MRLDVRQLRDSPGERLEAPVAVQFDAADISADVFSVPKPFAGQVEAIGTGDGVLVRFRISGSVELQCARCLQPFPVGLQLDFTEEYRPVWGGGASTADADAEVEAEAPDILGFTGDEIELDDAIRQQLLMELPMKPLCQAACAGLCSQCGHNLNEGPCKCQSTQPDTRLSGLQEWLDRHGRQ